MGTSFIHSLIHFSSLLIECHILSSLGNFLWDQPWKDHSFPPGAQCNWAKEQENLNNCHWIGPRQLEESVLDADGLAPASSCIWSREWGGVIWVESQKISRCSPTWKGKERHSRREDQHMQRGKGGECDKCRELQVCYHRSFKDSAGIWSWGVVSGVVRSERQDFKQGRVTVRSRGQGMSYKNRDGIRKTR